MTHRYLTIVSILLLLLAAWLVSALVTHSDNEVALRTELARFVLPEQIDENSANDTLRLYKYWVQARVNPYLSIAGADAELLKTTTENFSENIGEFSMLFPEQERHLIQTSLYPTSLLRQLSETEFARERFLSNPTKQSASTYHSSLVGTLQTYIEDSENFAQVLSRMENKEVGFSMGTTNATFVAQKIRSAQDQAKKLLKKEQRRYSCLLGARASCSPLSEVYSDQLLLDAPESSRPIPEHYQKYAEAITRSLSGQEDRAPYSLVTEEVSDIPIVILSESLCFSPEEDIPYKTWWGPSRSSDSRAVWVAPVHDLFFLEYENVPGTYFREAYENGVRHVYHPLSPLCVDSGLDTATALSSLYIRSIISDGLLPSEYSTDTDPALEELVSLEEKITQGEQIYAQDVARYSALLEHVFATHGESWLASRIGADRTLLASRVVLAWRTKSAWLESVIGLYDDVSTIMRNISKKQELPVESIFLTRSFAASTFLLSNQTLVNQPVSLIKTRHKAPYSLVGLVSYNESLRESVPITQLSQYILETAAILNRLNASSLPIENR